MTLWSRLPIAPRALVAGFVVSTVGQIPHGVLVSANLRWLPSVPWGALGTAVWLWLFWRYLEGRGWPPSSADARRRALRAGPLSPRVWRWSLAACGIASLALRVMLDLARRLSTRPAQDLIPPEQIAQVPASTSLLLFLAAAATAGVVEEAAFRGYMQSPIERRRGPVAAITFVATVFSLAHYRWGAPDPVPWLVFIPCYVGVSVAYGMLASLTGSIVPGVIGHFAVDAAGLLRYWRLGIPRSVWQAGFDAPFWIEAVILLLAAAGTVWAYRRLASVVRSERSAGVQPGAAPARG